MTDPERAKNIYRILHEMPEIGFEEERTSHFLGQGLSGVGYDVQTHVGGTGVIGTLHGTEPGPVLAIRAEMDALRHVVDGEACAIHSCGHDAHSAMVLTVAEIIGQRGIKCGTLKILFQPGEETLLGALRIIEAGAMDDVDIILGMHVRPVQEAARGQATPALCHAACRILEVDVEGQPAHGARPHLGVNAIDAAAAIVSAINAIHVNPMVPTSMKVTKLLAGGAAPNAIPGEAQMTLDLRAQENSVIDLMIDKATKAIHAGAASVGATARITLRGDVPAAEYAPDIVDIAREAILTVMGKDGLLPPIITPGGEDFHFYIKHRPAIKSGYIGLGCDLLPGLHHPEMKFDTDALLDGVNIFLYMVDKILGLRS